MDKCKKRCRYKGDQKKIDATTMKKIVRLILLWGFINLKMQHFVVMEQRRWLFSPTKL